MTLAENKILILTWQAAAASSLVQGYPGKVCFLVLKKCYYAERPVGRYYRPQYRPPSKCPSDYCTYKITRLLDSIELAKNFIEEARTVEKIKIR